MVPTLIQLMQHTEVLKLNGRGSYISEEVKRELTEASFNIKANI